ncbi:MAG: hypothetical protein AABX16_00605 [Nanoarchaeota archaeon]
MDIIYKPRAEEVGNFAVAVPTNGPLMIIQEHYYIEELERGYRHWKEFAESLKITKPIPIERIEKDKWRVLTDLIK